ncbi:MAG: methionine--tRNA ligase subunit beta [Patescibacteria group bacterium]
MTISFEDFKKIELRIGQIKSAEKVEDSEKLLKLIVDFGEAGERQILAGLAKTYTPDSLIGVRAVFVFNLEPRKLMGLESQGMLLAAESEEGPMILVPYKDAPPGSIIN